MKLCWPCLNPTLKSSLSLHQLTARVGFFFSTNCVCQCWKACKFTHHYLKKGRAADVNDFWRKLNIFLIESFCDSVSEEIIWGLFLRSPTTIAIVNISWTLFIGWCLVSSQDSSCCTSPVIHCTQEPTLAFTHWWLLVWPPWADFTTPRCANDNKHSRSQPLGPASKPSAASRKPHMAIQTQRGTLTKDLTLKEFNWPWIMKYL